MKYWVFIVANRKDNGRNIQAREILDTRLSDAFWGLGERTPNRKWLMAGDKIVFYEGNANRNKSSTGGVKDNFIKLSSEERSKFSHGKSIFTTDYGVYLEDIHLFENPIPVEQLVDNLKFIKNKEYWYSHFQGGTREIFEKDYYAITMGRPTTLSEQIKETEDLVSESQFALEAHLEEFMFNNWSQIDFGEQLLLYNDGEQNGRQYPAETWSIDFLCLDTNNNFVVIELKRGKTSDATIGQLLRYIGWVKENLASPSQKVRGIIIANDKDNALRYSAGSLQDVRVMTYSVDFHLQG